jgi:hypothetical protein
MKIITYAGDRFTTGDEIALAIVDYARALAQAGNAATVDVPVRRSENDIATATLLIGPASQLMAEDAPGSGDEIEDVALVADLRRRTRALDSPTPAQIDDEPPAVVAPDDFDL